MSVQTLAELLGTAATILTGDSMAEGPALGLLQRLDYLDGETDCVPHRVALLGHVHDAEPALAEALEQRVSTDHRPRSLWCAGRRGRRRACVLHRDHRREQLANLRGQRRVLPGELVVRASTHRDTT